MGEAVRAVQDMKDDIARLWKWVVVFVCTICFLVGFLLGVSVGDSW